VRCYKLWTIAFLLCVTQWGVAQDQCEISLTQAFDEFNAGHFYAIPALLKECLDRNQNPEWRQRAYLLLSETYLLLEDPVAADEMYLKVLRANPEYVTDDSRDPIDLVYLSRRFTATPIFSIYGKFGANTSFARVIHDVRIGGESYTKERYNLRIGWQAGIGVEWHYREDISLVGELNYRFFSYKHTTSNLFGANKDRVEMIDRQMSASIPLMIKYSDTQGTFRPYGYIGYSVNLLLGDRGIVKVFNVDDNQNDVAGGPNTAERESPALNLKDKRASVTRSCVLGAGVKYKLNLNYIFVDVRYNLGLSNVVNTSNRYSGLVDQWPYVDDDFRLDNVFISVGYVHPFYKPRKLKYARTKAVLRNLIKDSE